ncbi:MAG: SH3 domain-containing protein [Maricaulaceae bacterium]
MKSIWTILAIALPNALFAYGPSVHAQDKNTAERIIIRQPIPSVKNIHHVSAQKTPSGFDVPRYVSLKFTKVNGRMGPSRNHSIKWQYRRKGLPVIIVAETDMWRKVRDYKGDESWVYRAGLTGRRHLITIRETVIHKKPSQSSRKIAVTDEETLLMLESCNETWCRITSSSEYKGWVKKADVWGAETLN